MRVGIAGVRRCSWRGWRLRRLWLQYTWRCTPFCPVGQCLRSTAQSRAVSTQNKDTARRSAAAGEEAGGLRIWPPAGCEWQGVNAARRPLTPCYNGAPNRATGGELSLMVGPVPAGTPGPAGPPGRQPRGRALAPQGGYSPAGATRRARPLLKWRPSLAPPSYRGPSWAASDWRRAKPARGPAGPTGQGRGPVPSGWAP